MLEFLRLELKPKSAQKRGLNSCLSNAQMNTYFLQAGLPGGDIVQQMAKISQNYTDDYSDQIEWTHWVGILKANKPKLG